jgi:hypothetical protein
MKFNLQIESFLKNYIKSVKEKNAAIFVGAGMSVSQGFFNWKDLLKPLADRLELDIEEEKYDLAALAQLYVDSQGGVRGALSQILVDEYSKTIMGVSENHRILAKLPIDIYWTTNYDQIIEKALKEQGKTPDIKKVQSDFIVNLPKRDVVLYKMHGDIQTVADTIITKNEYEDFNRNRELFSNAFKNDYVSRTFLFIGFSFTDPNLDYLISRIRNVLIQDLKPHYYFIKKDSVPKIQHKQELKAQSLLKYGLNPLWINNYSEITSILQELNSRLVRNTIFISGSADEFGTFGENRALEFIYNLSNMLSKNSYKILSGFGLSIGSAVINGVLGNMKTEGNQNIDNYLILRSFPQFASNGQNLSELWKEYREKFIPLAGIAIFVFGNKKCKDTGKIIDADGVIKEFEIAFNNGLCVIPISTTGYVAKTLWEKVIASFSKYYPDDDDNFLLNNFKKLDNTNLDSFELIQIIINIINHLNYKIL